jgi:hypothetical protein
MEIGRSLRRLVVGALVVLVLVAGVGVVMAQTASAQGGGGPFGGDGPGRDGGIDREALLAEALGITVEELQAAELKADEAMIGQMQANGTITAEQASLMLAQLKVRSYLDRDKLTAEALGMTVEELQAARKAGKTMPDLLSQQGIDEATFQANLKTARDKAIDQAVSDGVITAEQAAALKADQRGGMGGPGEIGPGGHPGGRGRMGGGPGRPNSLGDLGAPGTVPGSEATPDDASGSGTGATAPATGANL